jgi:peptide/nickel transport system ATP-binding protein
MMAKSQTKPDKNTPVLECKDLSISYYTRAGEIPAVVDFNLTVMPGEAVGIVGESGCGKSTVALAIMQYMGKNGAIVGGEINFMGRDMRTMSEAELQDLRGSRISMVYQEPMASLNPSMLIREQLNEVLIFHEGVTEEEASRRSIEMLDAVRLPDPDRVMDSYPHQISGGQQQRVVIAMALLSKPQLLLLDEPTTALDVTVEAGVVELIKDISKKFGTSMIYISHNLGLILETCDKIAVMYSGEAVEFGTVNQVFDEMRHPYTRGLFNSIPLPGADRHARPLVPIRGQLPLPHERPRGCNFGPRCDHFRDGVCNVNELHMQPVKGAAGQSVRCVRYDEIDWEKAKPKAVDAPPPNYGETVLQVKNMQKYYEVNDGSISALLTGKTTKYVKANEKLDFEAREAETVAIVGESGCGKSTFAKVMMGLETATGGEVILNGKEIGNLPVNKRSPQLVGSLQMVFQNPFETLNPSHTVGSQIARVLRKFGVAKTKDEAREKVYELLDLVKLPRDFAQRRPRQLSGGQKQRVGIARAFGGEAAVVVADEPVSALDVSVQAAVTGLLTDIQREKRTTLLFISHDLSVVRYLADRVVVMYLGQIMEQGNTEDIFSPPYHPYTEALLSAVPIADTSIEKKHIVLEGELPSPMNPPSGCPFQTRCPRKIGAICETEMPPVRDLGNGHKILCHLDDDVLSEMEPVIALPGDAKAKKTRKKVTSTGGGRAKAAAAASRLADMPKSRAEKPAAGTRGTAERKRAAASKAPPTRSGVAAAASAAGSAGTSARAQAAPKKSKPKTTKVASAKAVAKSGPARLSKPKGKADDLKLIAGVGPKLEGTLNKLGFWHFDQIAKWTKKDIAIVDDELSFKGRIERDDWVKQAKALAKGGEAEYIKVFGKKPR